jgi:predicted TIM-barrel fold metal-dependent hydrolase
MEVAKDLFLGLQVSFRGIGLGGAENAQRHGNIRTRAYGRVLKATEEAGVDVLSHSGKGKGGHVREAEIEIEIETVYNMYRVRRLLSLGPPNYAIHGTY